MNRFALLLQIAAYGAVGVINTGVDIGIFSLLIYAGSNPFIANFISFSTGGVVSFLLNKNITFRNSGVAYSRDVILKFVSVVLLSLVVSQVALFFLLRFGMSEIAAKLVTVVLTFVVGFVLNKAITFRNKAA